MNRIFTGLLAVVLLSATFTYGRQGALQEVKASCDNPDAFTVLAKENYICMSEEDMKNTIKQVYIMGLNARNKQKEL